MANRENGLTHETSLSYDKSVGIFVCFCLLTSGKIDNLQQVCNVLGCVVTSLSVCFNF